MKIERQNLGELIRHEVERKGLSKAKFSESVGIARQNVEKTVFQKHGLDTDLLCRICEVLDCNFFYYFQNIDSCNNKHDDNEIRATLTIELGKRKESKRVCFNFGENNIEILDK